MKVLIVNRYLSIYGGAETVVKNLALELKKMGVENLILALNTTRDKNIYKDLNIITPSKEFPYLLRSSSFISSCGILKEILILRRLVKKYVEDFDLINVHNFPASWIAGNLNKPVVWMCNEVPDFYNMLKPSLKMKILRFLGISLDRYIVNKTIDTICVAEEFGRENVFRRYKRDAEVVPYGIEFESFLEEPAIPEYEYLKDYFLVLQVGMVTLQKNQFEAVKAIKELKEKIPNIKLILAGKEEKFYADFLKRYIEENALNEDIIFTGHLSKEKIFALYKICKLAVFPVKTQGGWLSPFEALCMAKPIIVSTTMGASNLIKKYNLGIVSNELTKSIFDIYNNYDFFLQRAKEASLWVKNNLTWERFAKRMLEIFQKTLERKR
ncbi:MAG: glycosyltransferase family 4 protein [Candidatus Aenigmatarchaeota archaeon]